MPGADKKWDAAAERDLCVAIIMGNQETDRVRYNWAKVHALMETYGYPFSKDAISQHFSKVIMKDFKARHTGGRSGTGSTPSTPKKRTPTAKGASTSGKRGRPKAIKPSPDADVDMETPTKKFKYPPTSDGDDDDDEHIKPEEGYERRDRSATLVDNEDEYQAWLNADNFES